MPPILAEALTLRPLQVRDYQCLIDQGCFGPEEHIELLNGQLIQMAAKGTRYAAAVSRLARLLGRQLGETVLIRLQDPIALNDQSQPEPDLAIVLPHPLDYADHHPTPAEIHWLIEVADSTLTYDTQTKARAYAQAGLGDYWVLDLPGDRLWVFRNPNQAGYGLVMQLDRAQSIAPIAFPNCTWPLADLLPIASDS
ncbi:MAG: Uma2 family endonuclease [Limnothrix sp. CACIAM 69d]|nr:MAG: Uma2 family endonuclease [Limnothrix sp. CACIAM 69d]